MDMSPSQSTQPLAVLERAYDFVLKAFGDTLKLRHRETGEHSKRVAGFSIAIAAQLQLSPKQISIVGRGAFLHDVGKIGVPDSVLLKPGKLSNDELVTMQTYCANGYEIVKTVPFLAEAAEIVYCHQERPDGKGYPRGLKGNDIPLGAKIVAIANALDAITSDWPYPAPE